MKKLLHITVTTMFVGICGISEGMIEKMGKKDSSNTCTEQEEARPIVTPVSLAQKYVNDLKINAKSQSLNKMSKAIKESYFRTCWRKEGSPGKGTEYSKAIASLLLGKISCTDINDDFRKIKIILNRIDSGKVDGGILTIRDFSFLKVPEKVLNSVGIW